MQCLLWVKAGIFLSTLSSLVCVVMEINEPSNRFGFNSGLTVRHLCDELNERLTQTCELELRSLCLYLCFSKSAAA